MKEPRFKLPKLRRSRQAKQLSQVLLAKKAKVSPYQVAVAELGRLVRLSCATALAKALGVQLTSLRS